MLKDHIPHIIASGILVLLNPIAKYIINKLIRTYSVTSMKNEKRAAHVMRIVSMIINVSIVLGLGVIWGVEPENVMTTLSAVFAVIGVAMFAQWSLLSNITAGVILFFTTPFKIGDHIHILDKDMPLDATIEEIFTFHIHLRTTDGELVVLPNNLFMQKMVSVKENK